MRITLGEKMKNLYTVKDQVSETYLPPFAYACDRDAIDAFRMAANDSDSPYNKHPSDFLLVSIGEYDERSAKITAKSPELIISATEVINE